MHTSNRRCINKKKQQILGSYKTIQTVIVMGLLSQWKQLIYYDFDTAMRKGVLLQIICDSVLLSFTVLTIRTYLGLSNLN